MVVSSYGLSIVPKKERTRARTPIGTSKQATGGLILFSFQSVLLMSKTTQNKQKIAVMVFVVRLKEHLQMPK